MWDGHLTNSSCNRRVCLFQSVERLPAGAAGHKRQSTELIGRWDESRWGSRGELAAGDDAADGGEEAAPAPWVMHFHQGASSCIPLWRPCLAADTCTNLHQW